MQTSSSDAGQELLATLRQQAWQRSRPGFSTNHATLYQTPFSSFFRHISAFLSLHTDTALDSEIDVKRQVNNTIRWLPKLSRPHDQERQIPGVKSDSKKSSFCTEETRTKMSLNRTY